VFDARQNPNAWSTTITNLIGGKTYWFRVSATDFNGDSLPSEILEVYACGLPRNFVEPTYVWSTQTSIQIQWNQPLNDGGCPVYDYRVERDSDATGLSWSEVNPIESYPRNDPYIL
jgi:hypothetical protein